MRTYSLFAIAGLALAGPDIALAEVLTVEGVYPARTAGAVEVEEITVERFGGKLKLLNPNERVHNTLTITKLLPIFEVFDNEEKALASWTQNA